MKQQQYRKSKPQQIHSLSLWQEVGYCEGPTFMLPPHFKDLFHASVIVQCLLATGYHHTIFHLKQLSCVVQVILKSLPCSAETELPVQTSSIRPGAPVEAICPALPILLPLPYFATRTRHSSLSERSPPPSLCHLVFTRQGCLASFPSAPSSGEQILVSSAIFLAA